MNINGKIITILNKITKNSSDDSAYTLFLKTAVIFLAANINNLTSDILDIVTGGIKDYAGSNQNQDTEITLTDLVNLATELSAIVETPSDYIDLFDSYVEKTSTATSCSEIYFQPSVVTELVTRVLDYDHEKGGSVYNPYAGLCSYGLNIRPTGTYHAQEIDDTIWRIGQMRLMLNGIDCSHLEKRSSTLPLSDKKKYSYVVATPPFNTHINNGIETHEDKLLGTCLNVLDKKHGKAVLLLSQGALTSTVWKTVIGSNALESIVLLPDGLIYDSSTKTALAVLKYGRKAYSVKLLDAGKYTISDSNIDTTPNVDRILKELNDSESSACITVTNQTLLDNNCLFVPERYRFQQQFNGISQVPLSTFLTPIDKETKTAAIGLPGICASNLSVDASSFHIYPKDIKKVWKQAIELDQTVVLIGKKRNVGECYPFGYYAGHQWSHCYLNSDVMAFSLNEDVMIPEFLFHAISNSKFLTSGKSLSAKQLLSGTIPCPSREEQAHYINAINNDIKPIDKTVLFLSGNINAVLKSNTHKIDCYRIKYTIKEYVGEFDVKSVENSRIDAIVVDTTVKRSPKVSHSGIDMYGPCIDLIAKANYFESLQIPLYVLTNSDRSNFRKHLGEYFFNLLDSRHRIIDKEQFGSLLDDINSSVSQIQKSSIKYAHWNEYEAAMLLDIDCAQEILNDCLQNGNAILSSFQNTKLKFNAVRQIVEKIFDDTAKRHITPKLRLGALAKFLKDEAYVDGNPGAQTLYALVNKDIMPTALRKTLPTIVDILNSGSHNANSVNMDLQKYVRDMDSTNLYKSVVYYVMDLLIWYKSVITQNVNDSFTERKLQRDVPHVVQWDDKLNCYFCDDIKLDNTKAGSLRINIGDNIYIKSATSDEKKEKTFFSREFSKTDSYQQPRRRHKAE